MCLHTPSYPEPSECPTVGAAMASLDMVDGDNPDLAEHPLAVTVPADGRTKVDRAFWEKCSPCQRACVLSHERSHTIIGLDCPCESCADKVGGYLMRLWGFTVDVIEQGYDSLKVKPEPQPDEKNTPRDAGANAREGAEAGAQLVAARGLTGVQLTREALLKTSIARPTADLSLSLAQTRQVATVKAPTADPTAKTPQKTVPTAPPQGDASRTVSISDPSFGRPVSPVVPDAPAARDGGFATQVVVGIIAAAVVAVLIGRS